MTHTNTSVSNTSTTVDCTGFNACLVSVNITGTGTWNVSLQGKFTSDGTFMDIYDNNGNQLSFGNTSTNQIKLFVAIPNYIQVAATEVVDGATLTTKVLPINI